MNLTLLTHTPNPESICAQAAAICYRSEPSSKVLCQCLKAGHLSIFEHASATFLIEGISRVTSHQLVRHRIGWSYSQVSQRYTGCSRKEVVIPEGLDERCYNAIHAAYDAYEAMISDGVPKEDARYVLPNAAMTDMIVTANFRALLHFFELRLCLRAQWEILELAEEMWQECRKIAPVVFRWAGPNCDRCREKCCPGRDAK
jgi:thymidylate synthase (FAD)